jgi:hypothetical protein
MRLILNCGIIAFICVHFAACAMFPLPVGQATVSTRPDSNHHSISVHEAELIKNGSNRLARVNIIGALVNPGLYDMPSCFCSESVLNAVAQRGGFRRELLMGGAPRWFNLIREEEGKKRVFRKIPFQGMTAVGRKNGIGEFRDGDVIFILEVVF